ncbi:MAG TPA: elongation factor P-like protein YeiP [Lentisphaeria bacterium]|nr:elongation factor P-like protein YeiP [Lentisphaeria bacterium]|tara:strand:+ start:568 stop:1137 length:570 start_codon:yes stop_codon:yes gene_type:complete
MISASDLKRGIAIDINGEPCIVENIQVKTPSARGGSTLYKFRARSIVTGTKVDQSVKGDSSYKESVYDKKAVQFLYRGQDSYTFMDLEDYSQFDLDTKALSQEANFMVEDMELTALVIDGVVRGVVLPDTVNLKIVECDPAVKSASATARTKNATLQTGFTIQVPEYLEADELVKIDTRDGRFVSRAND